MERLLKAESFMIETRSRLHCVRGYSYGPQHDPYLEPYVHSEYVLLCVRFTVSHMTPSVRGGLRRKQTRSSRAEQSNMICRGLAGDPWCHLRRKLREDSALRWVKVNCRERRKGTPQHDCSVSGTCPPKMV